MATVDITVYATNVELRPDSMNHMTVDLEDVEVSELVAQIDADDILEHMDKSEVMKYYADEE